MEFWILLLSIPLGIWLQMRRDKLMETLGRDPESLRKYLKDEDDRIFGMFKGKKK